MRVCGAASGVFLRGARVAIHENSKGTVMRKIASLAESHLRGSVLRGLLSVVLLLLVLSGCSEAPSPQKADEHVGTTAAALLAPLWTATVSMNVARQNHVAALLANGSVLVAGGHPGNNIPTSDRRGL